MIVEHVDFWAVPVTDMERSKRVLRRDTRPTDDTTMPASPSSSSATTASSTCSSWRTSAARSAGRTTPASRSVSRTSRRPARELEEKGVEFNGDVLDTGVCHMAFFADPDGNQIVLHRRYARRLAG